MPYSSHFVLILLGGIYGDLGPGGSFGLTNLALMAIDFDEQMSASEGVERGYDGSVLTYHVIQDFRKVL